MREYYEGPTDWTMIVCVENVYPPIPIRSYDWCAYAKGTLDDGEPGIVGNGETMMDAVHDFLIQHYEEE